MLHAPAATRRPHALVLRCSRCRNQGLQAMAIARAHGVTMAFGSDLLGAMHKYQADEFLLRSQAGLPAREVLAAATINCAALFMQEVRAVGARVGRPGVPCW
jgi:imidazolonepropionase-like amidohydrolase